MAAVSLRRNRIRTPAVIVPGLVVQRRPGRRLGVPDGDGAPGLLRHGEAAPDPGVHLQHAVPLELHHGQSHKSERLEQPAGVLDHIFVIKALTAGGGPAGRRILPNPAVADGADQPAILVQQQAGAGAVTLHLLLDDGAGVISPHVRQGGLILLPVPGHPIAVPGLQAEFLAAVGLDDHGIAVRLPRVLPGHGDAQGLAAGVNGLLVVQLVQHLRRRDEEAAGPGEPLPLLGHGVQRHRPHAEEDRAVILPQQRQQSVRVVRIRRRALDPPPLGHEAGGEHRRFQGGVLPGLGHHHLIARAAQGPRRSNGRPVLAVRDHHRLHLRPPVCAQYSRDIIANQPLDYKPGTAERPRPAIDFRGRT